MADGTLNDDGDGDTLSDIGRLIVNRGDFVGRQCAEIDERFSTTCWRVERAATRVAGEH